MGWIQGPQCNGGAGQSRLADRRSGPKPARRPDPLDRERPSKTPPRPKRGANPAGANAPAQRQGSSPHGRDAQRPGGAWASPSAVEPGRRHRGEPAPTRRGKDSTLERGPAGAAACARAWGPAATAPPGRASVPTWQNPKSPHPGGCAAVRQCAATSRVQRSPRRRRGARPAPTRLGHTKKAARRRPQGFGEETWMARTKVEANTTSAIETLARRPVSADAQSHVAASHL